MQVSWMLLKLDTISWGETLQNSHNFVQRPVVNTLCQERLDQREHQNWTRIGSRNLLLARQIWSWDHIHVHEQRQFSLLGRNFSWLKQVCYEFEQQWAGNLRSAARRICVEIECKWFCMPIKGQSKTTKTRTCRFFHKNNTYSRKNLDRCWTRRTFNFRLWSVEEIDHREYDGAIEFWRMKDNLQKYFSYYHHWSDEKWKNSMARGGGNKKRSQYCAD